MREVHTFVAILTALTWTDYSYAQSNRSTGLNFLDESQYRSIPLASTPLLGSIPENKDLSNYFPIPQNQGRQSSCVGWAVSNLKSYQEKVERKWDLSDDNHIFSPAYIYNQIKTSSSCDGGSNFIEALNLIRKSGAATMADFPYDENQCTRVPTAAVNQRAREFAIADWRRVNVQDETEIKTQISSGFPVLIGMMVDDSFGSLSRGQVYSSPGGQNRGGHAMVVVGYSDSKAAFKVINSWGTQWGDGGFGWINYSVFRNVVREAFVAQDIVIFDPNVSPAPPLDPSPGPRPSPVAVTEIDMGTPVVTQNSMIQTPTGLQPGIQLKVPGLVKNAAGRSMQLVVKFNYFNGPPLRAHPAEPTFRDTGGLVATGTPPIPIASNSESMDSLQMSIPYYALNFPPTGGAMLQNLSLTVFALVDNQQKAQSVPISFQLRW